MIKAEVPAETGIVTTHASTMFLNNLQSTPSVLDLAQPTKTTEPTLQCVVLMGRPILDASNTVKAAPISIVKPLEGVILVKSFPMVSMTRLPHIHNPNEIPIPPNNSK